jgi:hypothetical protein
VYYPHGAVVPETVAVNVRNRDHEIVADVEVPAGVVPNGVLIGLGSALGGWVLYVVDGRLRYVHNLAGKDRHRVVSDVVIGAGAHTLAFRFTKTAEYTGRGSLRVDGTEVGAGDIPFFTPVRFSITGAGLSTGYDLGPAISDDYVAPFPFNATLHRVTVSVNGAVTRHPEAEFEAIMSEQ